MFLGNFQRQKGSYSENHYFGFAETSHLVYGEKLEKLSFEPVETLDLDSTRNNINKRIAFSPRKPF
jgi:hypothetical protein